MTALRKLGTTTLEDNISQESLHLVKEVSLHQLTPFDPGHLIKNAVSNIIRSLIFGTRYEYSDEQFKTLLHVMDSYVQHIGNAKFLFLGHTPSC